MGRPLKIVIDDRIPLKANPWGLNSDEPVNSKVSPNGAWWLIMLEKAYAKLNVNYANLDGGVPVQSFRDLTGMPVLKYEIDNQTDEQFFAIIHDADKRGWPMVAACIYAVYGLNNMHAYTIIDTVELTKDGKPYQKLIKMRNPWGTETYNGAWSDGSNLWTEEFR